MLDDVWNESHNKWDELKCLLKGGAKESEMSPCSQRIMVMFEDKSVALIHEAYYSKHDIHWHQGA